MKPVLTVMPIALLPALFWLAPSGQLPSNSRLPIGYVNAQRIVAETADGKANVARFQSAQQQKATEIRAKQQELEATRLQLFRATDDSSRAKWQRQEQQQRTDLERATALAQTDLQELQRQMNTDLQTRLRPFVEELAKAQNLQVILNADATILWSVPGMDLTPALVDRLNAQPAPAPKQ